MSAQLPAGDALLPCPFCDGPAVNVAAEYITCGAGWSPMCAGHMVKTTPTLWNTRPSGWQPIETAPKDGTRIDLWLHRSADVTSLPEESWRIADAFWHADGWHREDNHAGTVPIYPRFVTHWRPLPAPPCDSGSDPKGEKPSGFEGAASQSGDGAAGASPETSGRDTI